MSASTKSAMASACVRSRRPCCTARRVNSPGSAGLSPGMPPERKSAPPAPPDRHEPGIPQHFRPYRNSGQQTAQYQRRTSIRSFIDLLSNNDRITAIRSGGVSRALIGEGHRRPSDLTRAPPPRRPGRALSQARILCRPRLSCRPSFLRKSPGSVPCEDNKRSARKRSLRPFHRRHAIGIPLMTNLLANETSPYLLQHKDNPVHWRPWGPEVLADAQRTNRLVLVSVGYAACHWCHVMAHESFEDSETAKLMNELYVCVKVDREERPDIDTWLQKVPSIMGKSGGWPLNVFLTPKGEPFWGGHLFSEGGKFRAPRLQGGLRDIAERYRDTSRNGGAQRPPDCATARSGLVSEPRRHLRHAQARPCGGRHGAELRHFLRRHSGRAEISQRAGSRTSLARLSAHRHAAISFAYAGLARQYGPRRNLRSSRRRICALCDRRAMAGAAFREDALRQCAAHRHHDAGLAARKTGRAAQQDRRDHRLGVARNARRGCGLRLEPRCRFRRRGRQVLCLDRSRDRCGARRHECRPLQAGLWRHARRQFPA